MWPERINWNHDLNKLKSVQSDDASTHVTVFLLNGSPKKDF